MGVGFTDVIEKADTRIQSILSDYKKIYKIYNLDVEPKRVLDQGYGIIFGRMDEEPDMTRHLTSRGDLIIIMTQYLNLLNDNQDRAIALYNDVETLIRSFKDGTRLNSNVIIDIGQYSVTQPVPIEGTEHIMVEVSFNVLFRETL